MIVVSTVVDTSPLRERVLVDCSAAAGSSIHGAEHWQRVEANVLELVEAGATGTVEIATMFAVLHDSHRANDGHDPQHGHRAAVYAMRLAKEGLIELDPDGFRTLVDALVYHADGKVSDDPTIGLCWDADRLDLPRVGITPDPRYLSTEQGRAMAENAGEVPGVSTLTPSSVSLHEALLLGTYSAIPGMRDPAWPLSLSDVVEHGEVMREGPAVGSGRPSVSSCRPARMEHA